MILIGIKFQVLLLMPILLLGCSRVRRDYYPGGNLRSEISVSGDRYNGPAKFYYENGAIQMECSYSDDKLNGALIRYYESGRPKEFLYYSNNKPDSLYRLLAPEGTLLLECNYSDSILEGPFTEYYTNGRVKIRGQYVHGMCDGVWLYYDPQGAVTGIGEFVLGTGIRKEYSSDGTLKQVMRFVQGLPVEEPVFR